MRGLERNQTQSIGNGPALGRKAKYIFKAVVASLPAPGADPKSEPDGLCVSQLAQAAVRPSPTFSVQSGEALLPSLHSVLRRVPECFAQTLAPQSHRAADQVS